MKLRNKKTGEIVKVEGTDASNGRISLWDGTNRKTLVYNSLAELNGEWEDYEEPKQVGYWYYDTVGNSIEFTELSYLTEKDKELDEQIGNYFETREEAEKAVEKLKAWKRLKDKGARFKEWFWDKNYGTCIIIGDSKYDYIDDGDEQNRKDLDLLFGGEE